jgi:hypothetical protein
MNYAKAMLFAVVALAALLPSARADSGDSTIYTFTGDPLLNSGPFGTILPPAGTPLCNCSIDGSLTLSNQDALAIPVGGGLASVNVTPTSYSFSVDGFTLDQTNSTGQFGLGQLIQCAGCGSDAWTIYINENSNPGLQIILQCIDGCGNDSVSGASWVEVQNGFVTQQTVIGSEQGNGNGTWSVTVPEPGVLLLLGAGLLWLGAWKALVGRRACRS